MIILTIPFKNGVCFNTSYRNIIFYGYMLYIFFNLIFKQTIYSLIITISVMYADIFYDIRDVKKVATQR